MKLSRVHKKVVSIAIMALIIPLQLLFIFTLLYQIVENESGDYDALSILFVAGICFFPLFYAIRLWNEVKVERLAENLSINPETNIRLSVKIDLRAYRKLIFVLTYTRPIFLYINFIAIGLVLFALINTNADYWTLFFGIFVVYLPFAVYRSAGSNYTATKAIHENVQYEFTPEHIQVSGETFTSTQKWSTLYKVKEVREWFLLYTNKQNAMIIPKSGFTSPQQVDEFRGMAMKLTV